MNDPLVELYREKLDLQMSVFTRIDHDDAMVAHVFRISHLSHPDLILKICPKKSHFLREVYFLTRFAGKLPVPRIVRLVEPKVGMDGALLMECVPGQLLNSTTINSSMAYDCGSLLARIHLESTGGYGDLFDSVQLSADPRHLFKVDFEVSIEECKGHLPENLMARCSRHFNKDIDLLLSVDGPRIVHHDFRPGNLIASNGKVTGIIDWSAARSGFAEQDFYDLEFGGWPQSHKNSFLNGYASVRKVPNYLPLIPILRLKRAVGAIGFVVKIGTWGSKHSHFYKSYRDYLESLT